MMRIDGWEPMFERMDKIDVWKDKYHLQSKKFQESETERKRTVYSGLETLIHLFPMHTFCTPWKSLTVLWCFQGVEKEWMG